MAASRTAFNRAGLLLARRAYSTSAPAPAATTPAGQVTPALIQQLDGVYRAHAQSFYNFPVDKITFKVGQHFTNKSAHPYMYFGDSKEPGILHVTPFASATLSWFGAKGNFGRKLGFREGTVNNLEDAEQQVCISMVALDDNGVNATVKEYFAWLDAINRKLLDHLYEHQSEYAQVKQKVGGLTKKYPAEVIKDMMAQDSPAIIKTIKDKDTKTAKPNSEFLQFKQKVYYKATAETAKKGKIMIPEDEGMLQKGYVRRHIPLYDSEGVEIPITEAAVHRGDIISVQNNLMANVYYVASHFGFGLRRNLRSVVLFKHNPGADFAKKSPFASLPTAA